jgi:hypothetical protein
VQVFQEAVANLEAILSTAAKNPTPILTKILSNQITTLQALLASGGAFTIPSLSQILTALTSQSGALQSLLTAIQTAIGELSTALTTTVPPLLQTAFGDLTSANVEGAINNLLLAGFTALFPLTGLLGPTTAAIAQPLQNLVNAINLFGPIGEILANPLQNLVNVLMIPTNQSLNTELIFSGLIAPLIQTPAAFGTAVQGVINAITGVPGSPCVLQAIVDAPAVFLGGVLNGGLGPNVGPLVFPGLTVTFGGLLNPATFILMPLGLLLPGLIPALQQLQSIIAGALTPPAIPSAGPLQLAKTAAPNTLSALPDVAANKVTVSTTTAPTALAPRVVAPTVGSGPVTKVLTPPTPTANKSKVAGGNGTEVSGGLGKIAAGLSGGTSKHRN